MVSAVAIRLGQRKCVGQMPDFAHLAAGQQHLHDVEPDFHRRVFQQPQIIQRVSGRAAAACAASTAAAGRVQSSDDLVFTSTNARQSPSRKIKSISPRAERKLAVKIQAEFLQVPFRRAFCPSSPRRKCSGFALPANRALILSKKFIFLATDFHR